LPAIRSSGERAAAEAAGATVIDAERGDSALLHAFTQCLDDAILKHPARLSFHSLELDLDFQLVWANGTLIGRNLGRALFAALELLVRRRDAGAHRDELCAVSGTSTYESAPRKLVARLKDAIGTTSGVTIEKCAPGRYRLVPIVD
jgi:hypothetical protein